MYTGEFELIGSELSMFTRKLETQLMFQNIPFRWHFKTLAETEKIEARSGTRFVPLLKTPDGWLIHDTIAIGPFLNDRFDNEPVIPATPAQRSACFVLEDFFNHWLPRHALHSRWCYPDNVLVAGRGFGANMILGKSIDAELSVEELAQVEGMGSIMRDSFGLSACEIQGAGPEQSSAVISDFNLLMENLHTHFSTHEFLLGARPCLADFALAGTAKAHFLVDPEPLSWLGSHESMLTDYVNRVGVSKPAAMRYLPEDTIAQSLLPIFSHAVNSYHRWALASLEAAAKGVKHFQVDLGYGNFTSRSMRRLDKSRLHVQDEIVRCAGEQSCLKGMGVLDFYLLAPIITS